MKKFLILIIAAMVAGSLSAQDPEKSLSVQEAKALNGSAQPKMKDGRTYEQWVADEKAKRQGMKPAAVSNIGLVTTNASSAPSVAPNKIVAQQTGPDAGTAPVQTRVTETGVVKTEKTATKESAPELLPQSPMNTSAVQSAVVKEQVITGTSLENKAVVQTTSRTASTNEGSGEVSTPAKIVKSPATESKQPEAMNAALKGTSMDKATPAANPAQQTVAPAAPAQHSGNTAPAKTEEKPSKTQ